MTTGVCLIEIGLGLCLLSTLVLPCLQVHERLPLGPTDDEVPADEVKRRPAVTTLGRKADRWLGQLVTVQHRHETWAYRIAWFAMTVGFVLQGVGVYLAS